jgi:dethiobiotin synthetase
MGRAYFVTGTDTGVGKTLVAVSLLRLAREQGMSTLGLKPIAAGCELIDGQWINEDAQLLLEASSIDIDYPTVNPIALQEAMAPHIAAEREQRQIRCADLVEHYRPLIHKADFTVIEGAGGWQVPLNDSETMANLAVGLNCPVILVVGIRLGCINHALLTAAAIRQSGLQLAGWVANHIYSGMAVMDENVATLEQRLGAQLTGRLPWQDEIDLAAFSRQLNLDLLA